ncbi:uncharacterized protein DS421_1g15380 [Arachis hypogaea]|nr:uncharacterized protein DS421_1g15380 [Arachis hypogaea]
MKFLSVSNDICSNFGTLNVYQLTFALTFSISIKSFLTHTFIVLIDTIFLTSEVTES